MEMQRASFRIWSRVVEITSPDNNCYVKEPPENVLAFPHIYLAVQLTCKSILKIHNFQINYVKITKRQLSSQIL